MRYLCPLIVLAECLPAMATAEPLEAHPRPDWARPWVDLNGPWRFEFDPEDKGLKENWPEAHEFGRTITVPYPWQSPLSGIHDPKYQGVAWYERDVALPPAGANPAPSRVYMVFGAIDWQATVWVNGEKAAEHEGGYTPFEVELSKYAQPGTTARVTVRAYDVTDPETPNGKQTGWYTPTGGIWQSVYLESRNATFLRRAYISPDIDKKQARIDCEIEAAEAGPYALEVDTACGESKGSIRQDVTLKEGLNRVQAVLPIADPALWTPDTPNLYETTLRLVHPTSGTDTVQTYFGMRKVSRGVYGDSGHEFILLNDKPIYLRGALHQSFNPEGVHTHPDDDYIRRDYEKAKGFGLNFIRIHIKVDEPRALYWADKLGVLLMCDIPCFNEKTERAKQLWEQTLRATVERDFNHPAIFAWCDFNETWGIGDKGFDEATQRWVADMYRLTKELDPTRLVEDNSPCNYDHTVTDINSWHFYIDNYDTARKHIEEVVEKTYPGSEFNYIGEWRQETAPLINSEYGGVGAGNGDRDIGWCFLYLTNLLRMHGKIGGYVYTELEDIEWEHNGYMNYDRTDKEFPYPAGITLKDLQGDEFAVIDGPPYRAVKAGEAVSVPLLLSHWSEREGLSLRISVDGRTVDGRSWDEWLKPEDRAIRDAKPFAVTPLEPYDFAAPPANGIMNLVVEVLQEGKRVAANYCVFNVEGGAQWDNENSFAVSFPVTEYSAYGFGDALARQPEPDGPAKVFGYGAGYVEYTLNLPANLKPESVEGCRFIFEGAAKAERELVDWPERVNPQDYPQTDGRKWPTDLRVSINGVPVSSTTIETDFADAAGVLSHAAYYHHGSHGRVIEAPLADDGLAAVKAALQAKEPVRVRFEVPQEAANKGGLALYGRDMGLWPADPTFVFTLVPGARRPTGGIETRDVLQKALTRVIQRGPDGHVWRYTTQAPVDDWMEAGFDDSGWKTGPGGFGREGTPGARISTPWLNHDIWLRTTVDIPASFGERPVWVDLHHDEDAEVYVNGRLLLKKPRHTSDYERIILTEEQLALFKAGEKNTVAVHCHQTHGGQYIDMNLTTIE